MIRGFLFIAALFFSVLAAPQGTQAAEKLRISVATGGTGGVYYPYGGGIARIISRYGDNIQATAEVTGGSVDNIKLIAAGEAELGFSTIDSAVDALQGASAYADTGPQKIAVIAHLYDSFVHVVARAGTGIDRVAKMKGKTVSVGSAGSSTEAIADRLLAAAGLNPMKDVKRDNLSIAESAAALQDGKIDAFFWAGGLPTAAVSDLVTTGNVKAVFVPTDDLLAKLNKDIPGLYRPFTLPANIYKTQTAAVPGIGVANVLVVSANAKDDLVTRILAPLFAHLDEVHAIHPEAGAFSLAGAAAKTAVARHPAATAFYKARGIAAE